MARMKVGEVTVSEKNKILTLFERKLALEELESSLNSKDITVETRNNILRKIALERPQLNELFRLWWQSKSEKYSWMGNENCEWNIDFNTNEIFLVGEIK